MSASSIKEECRKLGKGKWLRPGGIPRLPESDEGPTEPPADPPEPGPPEPGPPDPAPGPAYVYDRDDPAPPEASREAIAALARVRGPAALADLRGAVAALDGAIVRAIAGLRSVDGRQFDRSASLIEDALRRRDVYRRRAAALGSVLVTDGSVPDAPAVPELGPLRTLALARSTTRSSLAAAVARAGVEARAGDHAVESASATLADPSAFRPRTTQPTSLRFAREKRLAGIGRDIRQFLRDIGTPSRFEVSGQAPQDHEVELDLKVLQLEVSRTAYYLLDDAVMPPPAGLLQDRALEAMDAALGRKARAAAALAEAQAREAAATELVAGMVRKAVDAAGGRDRVAESARDAMLLGDGEMLGALAGMTAGVRALTEGHRALERDLDRLATSGVDSGPAFDDLVGRRDAAMSRIVAARSDLATAHREHVAALVDAALAGDEAARARLEALASARPQCFPRGFPVAIAAAEHGAIVRAELARALGE